MLVRAPTLRTMPVPPAIADVLRICTNELGAPGAASLTAEAAVSAVASLLEPGELYGADDPGRAVLQVWAHLWSALARERPQAFLPNARGLDRNSPFSLAFAYARRREPDGLRALDLTAAERRALGTARRAVGELTGLPGLRRACRASVFTERCVALRYAPGLAAAGAHCAMAEPALRRHVLVVGDYAAECRANPVPHYLPLAVLHEEVHAAVAASCSWAPGSPLSRPLVQGLQEPAAVLCELYAEHLLRSGRAPTRVELRRLTHQHPDGHRARALMAATSPDGGAQDAVRRAVLVARTALGTRNDEHLVGALRHDLGFRHGRAWWHRTFG